MELNKKLAYIFSILILSNSIVLHDTKSIPVVPAVVLLPETTHALACAAAYVAYSMARKYYNSPVIFTADHVEKISHKSINHEDPIPTIITAAAHIYGIPDQVVIHSPEHTIAVKDDTFVQPTIQKATHNTHVCQMQVGNTHVGIAVHRSQPTLFDNAQVQHFLQLQALRKKLMITDPAYALQLSNAVHQVITNVAHALYHPSIRQSIRARLELYQYTLDLDFEYDHVALLHHITPLLFAADGKVLMPGYIAKSAIDEFVAFVHNTVGKKYRTVCTQFILPWRDVVLKQEAQTWLHRTLSDWFHRRQKKISTFDQTNFAQKVLTHSYNKSIYQLITYCENNDLPHAAHLVHRMHNDSLAQQLFIEQFGSIEKSHYNAQGILCAYEHDPAWTLLPRTSKQEIARTYDGQMLYNMYLHERAVNSDTSHYPCIVTRESSHTDTVCSTAKNLETHTPEYTCGCYKPPNDTLPTCGTSTQNHETTPNPCVCLPDFTPIEHIPCNYSARVIGIVEQEKEDTQEASSQLHEPNADEPQEQETCIEKVKLIITPEDIDQISEQERKRIAKIKKSIECNARKGFVGAVTDLETLEIIDQALKKHKQKITRPKCIVHGIVSEHGKHIIIPHELDGTIPNEFDWEKLVKPFDYTHYTPKECGDQAAVWIDFEHIFCPIIKIQCKTGEYIHSGFHHDYLGQIKKSGVLHYKDCIYGPHGIYEIEWSYDGKRFKSSTFFPDSWTRAQVVEKIFEAYRNKTEKPTCKRETWTIIGKTKEGIIIEIILATNKNTLNPTGKLITAYPNLKGTYEIYKDRKK